jgi:hypothetical protein
MGAEPRPASLLKRPRAIPKRIACITPAPANPPIAAWPLKAEASTISTTAGSSPARLTRMTPAPSR